LEEIAVAVLVAKEMFLTKGVGRHKEQLASFEAALRDAGIHAVNLVTVSSIYPPKCKMISRARGLAKLEQGQIAFCVLAREATDEPRRQLAASIGVAIPTEAQQYGYLSEYHGFGKNAQEASDYAEDLAAQMLATTLGVPFDPEAAWNDKKEQWRISGKIVKTMANTATAKGEDGMWTTVVSSAVMLF
jgi:arginine decarboxylase